MHGTRKGTKQNLRDHCLQKADMIWYLEHILKFTVKTTSLCREKLQSSLVSWSVSRCPRYSQVSRGAELREIKKALASWKKGENQRSDVESSFSIWRWIFFSDLCQAYHVKSLQHHPDKDKDNPLAPVLFQQAWRRAATCKAGLNSRSTVVCSIQVSKAYAALTDESARKNYEKCRAKQAIWRSTKKGGYQIKFRWYEWSEWSEWYEWISHFLEVHNKKFLISGFSSLQVWKSRWPSPDEGWVFASVNGEGGRQVNDEDPPSPVCFVLARIKSQVSPQINMIPKQQKKVNNIIQAWKFVWRGMDDGNTEINHLSSFVSLLIHNPTTISEKGRSITSHMKLAQTDNPASNSQKKSLHTIWLQPKSWPSHRNGWSGDLVPEKASVSTKSNQIFLGVICFHDVTRIGIIFETTCTYLL